MTIRSYWDRPLDRVFASRVVFAALKPGRLEVELEETLFHPEGGGQPADRGTIAFDVPEFSEAFGARVFRVVDVKEEAGRIVHVVELPKSRADQAGPEDTVRLAGLLRGIRACGEIDWSRRFDLMQQHTGQHVLSRAFEVVLSAKTVGFHLGEEYVSIDLSVAGISTSEVEAVERLANEIVFSDASVVVKQYRSDAVPEDIRTRLPIDSDDIRVVYVGDFDACACGGTHVASTGQIGLIKINGTDKAHGGARVIFRCGARALADYGQKERILTETAGLLSSAASEAPDAVRSLLSKVSSLDKEIASVKEQLLAVEIEKMIAEARKTDGTAFVVKHLSGKGPDELRLSAKKVSESTAVPVALFTMSPRFQTVVACPKEGPDARAVISRISEALGGRGGGTPQLSQLGLKEALPQPEALVIEAIESAILWALNVS